MSACVALVKEHHNEVRGSEKKERVRSEDESAQRERRMTRKR